VNSSQMCPELHTVPDAELSDDHGCSAGWSMFAPADRFLGSTKTAPRYWSRSRAGCRLGGTNPANMSEIVSAAHQGNRANRANSSEIVTELHPSDETPLLLPWVAVQFTSLWTCTHLASVLQLAQTSSHGLWALASCFDTRKLPAPANCQPALRADCVAGDSASNTERRSGTVGPE
jgi:hypothetical protein